MGEQWYQRGRVTLAFLFEGQFTLLVIVLVLSTTPIFTTLRYESVTVSCLWCRSCESMWVVKEQEWRKCLTFPLFLGIFTCSVCVWRIGSVPDFYEDITE